MEEATGTAAGSGSASTNALPAASGVTEVQVPTATTTLIAAAGGSSGNAPVLPMPEEDADFRGYSIDQLLALADTIARRNDLLEAENELFDSFYARHLRATAAATLSATTGKEGLAGGEEGSGPGGEPPVDLASSGGSGNPGNSLAANVAPAAAAAASAAGWGAEKKRAPKKRAGDLRAARGLGGAGGLGGDPGGEEEEARKRLVPLTTDQKHELGLKELDELKEETEAAKARWLHTMDSIQAELEEAEVRLLDLRKGEVEFRRDIVEGALHERTGKLMAEKVVRWMEDYIREKDGLVGKIKLKNATLKASKKKIQLSLKQKEEMGEVLHAIDFDQLQIENKQYLAKIEERNQELIKLKLTATNTVQILNTHKVRLAQLAQEAHKLNHEITSKQDFLAKLTQERAKVLEETECAESLHSRLSKAVAEYKVPSVMDYVLVKANEYAMGKKLRSWDRKLEIAVMQSKRVKNGWRKQVKRRPEAVGKLPPLPDPEQLPSTAL